MKNSKTRIISLILIIFLMATLFSACGMNSGIVGTWKGDRGEVEFFKDGTLTGQNRVSSNFASYGTGKWSIDGNRIKITDYYGETKAFDFTIQGNTLTLNSNGKVYGTFTKVN